MEGVIYFYQNGREKSETQEWFRNAFTGLIYIGHGKWRRGDLSVPRVAVRTLLIERLRLRVDDANNLVRNLEITGTFVPRK